MFKWKQWLISFFSACLLLIFSLLWMNTPFSYGDEILIVKWSSAVRDIFFRKQPDPNKYLFINLSREKELVSRQGLPGHDVITDRMQLSRFFKKIDRKAADYKFIFCDVAFILNSPYDDSLAVALKGLNRVAAATHFDDADRVIPIKFHLPVGITAYHETGGGFFKFRLFQSKKVSTLPVLLYQLSTKHRFQDHGWYWTDNGQPCFNAMIVDQPIRQFGVFQQRRYPLVDLSDLLSIDSVQLNHDYFNGKIIVMGDFDNDIHKTIFGETTGSIIILNIYLAMEKGLHLIKFWWVIYMLVGFTLISKAVFFHHYLRKNTKIRWLGPLIKTTLYLIFFSQLSYLIFDRQIQILVSMFALYTLDFFLYLKKRPLTWVHIRSSFIRMKKRFETA